MIFHSKGAPKDTQQVVLSQPTDISLVGRAEMHSIWKVVFSPEVTRKQDRYARIRFSSYARPAALDFFGPLFSFVRRERLDLRLYDARELAELQDVSDRIHREIIPVGNSYFYFVAPHVLRPDLYSPSLDYIRVLEDPLWRRYLGRKPSLFARHTRKMHVYAWKRNADPSSESPQRIFATLVPYGFNGTVIRAVELLFWFTSVLALILIIGSRVSPSIHALYDRASNATLQNVGSSLIFAALISFVLVEFPKMLDGISRWSVWIATAREWLDNKIYGL